jgi:hypothetical protein
MTDTTQLIEKPAQDGGGIAVAAPIVPAESPAPRTLRRRTVALVGVMALAVAATTVSVIAVASDDTGARSRPAAVRPSADAAERWSTAETPASAPHQSPDAAERWATQVGIDLSGCTSGVLSGRVQRC